MKQISQLKFAQAYDIDVDNAIVEFGKQRWLTDDLYIIRSTYKTRNYSYRNDGSAGQEYTFKPCWKLMSKNYDDARHAKGEYKM